MAPVSWSCRWRDEAIWVLSPSLPLSGECLAAVFAQWEYKTFVDEAKGVTEASTNALPPNLTTLSVLTAQAALADMVMSIADSIASDYSISRAERLRINDAANDALAEGLRGAGKPLVLTGGSLYAAALPDGGLTDESSPDGRRAIGRPLISVR